MIGKLTSAVVRAFLVALLLLIPALLLPEIGSDSAQFALLAAMLAALLVFFEYNSAYPSYLEFRYAPPFNRLRFGALVLTVFGLTMAFRHAYQPSQLTHICASLTTIIGHSLDFPYSPVRLVLLTVADSNAAGMVGQTRVAAGTAYFMSILLVFAFTLVVRMLNWPSRNGAFNVWINLPLFDPTTGGDVVARLQKDARVNVVLGFLLPFLVPALVKALGSYIDLGAMENPQTLIWTVSIWAFVPASMMMRGVALGRIAEMIAQKRRRAYAAAEAEQQGFQTA